MIARTTSISLIDALFVIAPNSLLLDIAGPAEAFRLANLHRAARGLPPRFRLRFTGPTPTVQTSVGLSLAQLEPFPTRLTNPTWVVLVGQPSAYVGKITPAIVATTQWLNQTLHEHLYAGSVAEGNADGGLHRLVTICSGPTLAAVRRIMNCLGRCAFSRRARK
ncbi:MAG: hypothetical protein ABL931_12420 [Usitatibacteraceae bacterium]